MINGIKIIKFENEKSTQTTFVSYKITDDEFTTEHIHKLSPKDIFLTETNKDGKPKSGLSRTLSIEETIAAQGMISSRLQTFIDLVDTGIPANDAAFLAKSRTKQNEYNRLTQTDENGNPTNGASRALSQEEGIFFVKDTTHCLTPSKVQDFINLVDEGVSMKDTKRLLMRKSIYQRYNELTKTDEEGKPKSGASRILTPQEAIDFISSFLTPNKIQNYIDLIDNGVSPQYAYKLAQARYIVDNYLAYTQTDENGNPKSGLSRVLTPDEAIFAITYKGNKNKMIQEIDLGLIKIPTTKKLDVQT
ncbi:hypothetical protein IJ182_00550 [bacterium]|nr:hypothetical protein [bacterium]